MGRVVGARDGLTPEKLGVSPRGIRRDPEVTVTSASGLHLPRSALRVTYSYAKAIFETVPVLAGQVEKPTANALKLKSGMVLAAYPCRPPAVRGLRCDVAILDEFAHFRTSEGYPTDTEMLRSIRPALATTDGRLVILSSPYAQSGALYDLYRANYGVEGSPILIWKATAPEMNPGLTANYLKRMETDPDAYRSEVLAEFRAGVSTLLDPDAIAACVASGVRERAPEPGLRYFAFADPSSGSGKDAFTLAISHIDYGGDRTVCDAIYSWKPPFDPSNVIDEASDRTKSFGLYDVTSDRYAPGFVSELFRKNGITWHASEFDRSKLYLELLPRINSRDVVLLDDAETLRELRNLERRRGSGGRDRVDHRSGAHDDRANSVAGSLVLALNAKRCGGIRTWDWQSGEIVSGWDNEGNEWRDRLPWTGTFPPETDLKGRPLGHWGRYVNGNFVGHIVAPRQGDTSHAEE